MAQRHAERIWKYQKNYKLCSSKARDMYLWWKYRPKTEIGSDREMAAACDAIQVYGNVYYTLIKKLQSYLNHLVPPSQKGKKKSKANGDVNILSRGMCQMLWLLREDTSTNISSYPCAPTSNFNTVLLYVVILHADYCSKQSLPFPGPALEHTTTGSARSHWKLNVTAVFLSHFLFSQSS